MVYGVSLHLVEDFLRIVNSLGNVGEYLAHLLGRLQPLLLGIVHTRLVEPLLRRDANQAVMRLAVSLLHEMHVVGGDYLDVIFACKLEQHLVDLALLRVHIDIGIGLVCLVPLQLDVIVIAEYLLEPAHTLLGKFQTPLGNVARHFAAQARRAYDQPLVMLRQFVSVGAGMVVEPFSPCLADELDQVVVALLVLCQHYEVVSLVVLVLAVSQAVSGTIHLAAEYRLELLVVAALGVDLFDIVEELLDAEHVAMVSKGDAAHAEVDSLVDEAFDRSLAVKQAVLRVHMEVCEWNV